jgi:hypothetical protein
MKKSILLIILFAVIAPSITMACTNFSVRVDAERQYRRCKQDVVRRVNREMPGASEACKGCTRCTWNVNCEVSRCATIYQCGDNDPSTGGFAYSICFDQHSDSCMRSCERCIEEM